MPSLVGFLQSLVVVVTSAAAAVRLLGWWFREKQGALLYHPDTLYGPVSVASPDEYAMHNFESLDIRTADGITLRSYLIKDSARQAGDSPLTVVHFHGNAGNIGHRLPLAKQLQAALGCNVVLAEYRGYGKSDPGIVNEQGLKLDAQATLDHVRSLPCVDPRGIVLYGASLGGAVAVDLAAKPENERKIAAIVIENSFTSISDMVDVLFKAMLEQHATLTHRRKAVLRWIVLRVFKPLFLWIGWRSIDSIARVKVPVLLMSGEQDDLIPPEHMQRLYASCRSSVKRLELVSGGGHNDTWARQGFMAAFQQFVSTHVLQQPSATSDMFRTSSLSPEVNAAARAGVGANTAAHQLDMSAWSKGGTLLRPFVGRRATCPEDPSLGVPV